MEVEAIIEPPLVFAGSPVEATISFRLPSQKPPLYPPFLLSGYAAVQGSFKLGDLILSEPFAETKKAGTVLTKRGLDYGQSVSNGGLFAGVLDGLKHLMGPSAAYPTSPIMGSGNSAVSALGGSNRINDDSEYPVFSTSQVLLFTDLRLEAGGESKQYTFTVNLPEGLPPTYRSRSLHISYNLVVGFQRVRLDGNGSILPNSRPQDTRLFLPFRVLSPPPTASQPEPVKFDLRKPVNVPAPVLKDGVAIKSTYDSDVSENNSENMDDFVEKLLSNECKSSSRTRNRHSSIQNIPGAHYTKVSYDINRGTTHIAQLVFAKPAIVVGDVLMAQLRFRRPCLHVSVYLELEEAIEGHYAALGSNRAPSSRTKPSLENERDPLVDPNHNQERESTPHNPSNLNESQKKSNFDEAVATTYTVYGKQFQGVYGLSEMPIFLPTLNNVTPRLDSEQLKTGWALRIEFVGLTGTAFGNVDDHELLAKGQIDHETFTCRIPVIILPPVMGGLNASKTWRFQ